MKFKSLIVSFLLVPSIFAQKTLQWHLYSPDKSLEIILDNEDNHLTYSIHSGEDIVIKPSRLGIRRSDEDFAGNLRFLKSWNRRVEDNYTLKIGKRRINRAVANEMTLSFENDHHALMDIEVRAYNDGIAFRYRFNGKNKNITVTEEKTEFTIGEGNAWMEAYDMPSEYAPAYEGYYTDAVPVGTRARDRSGWAFPALFHAGNHWILLSESNPGPGYVGSHLQSNCDQGIYRIAFPLAGEALGFGDTTANTHLPFETPWRVVITGRNPGTVVESNLIYHVADPKRILDDSWIKPGRSSWSWWSDHASSRDFNKLKKYVDLAADMGWEYSLVDANWNIMQGGQIEQLVQYASTRHVGLAFWYNSGGRHNKVTEQPRDIMNDPVKRKEEFHKLASWGVKAVKVDFFQSDKQSIIQLYLDILRDAAKEKIMVVFHGCTVPRGWSRTYPNLVSMEGVKGAEQYGWDKYFADHAAQHNSILAFTRNVIGPMDYTPVTFSDYPCCPHSTSNAHELALSVLFESGILHFADSDSSYRNQPARIQEILREVPNVWDDTKWLEGEPGKEIMLARRLGNSWWVACINGENIGKQVSVDLSFLGNGNYAASIFSDGVSSREIQVRDDVYQKTNSTSIHLLPYGGFLIHLEPR